jgi:hypothetical protein
MRNFEEYLGKDIAQKFEAFEAELKRIELENYKYFETRKPSRSGEPDSIRNHFGTLSTKFNNVVEIKPILYNQSLPTNILEACNGAFARIFHSNERNNQ